ncbi:unnamed protein product [Ranitomeya imitator]|uniref:BolA-like protein 1 n=1 Tax=Ranitomeya imitator TaxID=111125 RepID=A0ABN9M6T6_9NEOB|nr:unnamed protein product [Ranitomeya imitator]
MEKPVETSIRAKLSENLDPCHLEVHNESSMHAVPPGSETHFKVVVVSDVFSGKSLIQRHRLVNDLLKEELAGAVHALSIQAKTPQQWAENPTVVKSPGLWTERIQCSSHPKMWTQGPAVIQLDVLLSMHIQPKCIAAQRLGSLRCNASCRPIRGLQLTLAILLLGAFDSDVMCYLSLAL